MKRVVVIADTGWAVGRIHRDLAIVLAPDYTFTFHTASNFFMDAFMRDFRSSDICLTTLNHYQDMLNLFPKLRDRNKIAIVCHGYPELKEGSLSTVFTYGVTSSVVSPHISVPHHVVLTGVNPAEFAYTEPTGRIRTLGWCGCRAIESKRAEWGHALAKQTKLPISYAETLSTEDLKEWYTTIDVLLVTAGPELWKETGPLPPFEAICSGVLVIGVPVGNFSLLPGPKFHTIEEAVKIVNELKTDPVKVKALAKEQYECVMAKWTYSTTKESWLSMFNAIESRTITQCELIQDVNPTKATPLCEIMGRHGSDKGSLILERSEHNYTTVYHHLFEMKRNLPIRVFELGLGTNYTDVPSNMGAAGRPGASLRGWAEYFPLAHVFGADIDRRVLFQEERINTYYCDQTNPEAIRTLWGDLGDGFDVLIEDGLHEYDANVCFLENSLHKVNPDGYYVIEDIHVKDLSKMEAKVTEWKSTYPSFQFYLYAIPSKVNKTNNRLLIAHNTASPRRSAKIDAYLYINLAHRKDRKTHIEAQFEKAGVPKDSIHRMDAVYREKFGILGCVESHIQTLELAEAHPEWEWIAVFEDDFTFRKEGLSRATSLLEKSKPDVVLLAQGIDELDVLPTQIPTVMKVRSAKTTSGYIVHRSYLSTLKTNLKESRDLLAAAGKWTKDYCLDDYWRKLQKTGNWYAFTPSIGFQCESYSDIMNTVMAYNC